MKLVGLGRIGSCLAIALTLGCGAEHPPYVDGAGGPRAGEGGDASAYTPPEVETAGTANGVAPPRGTDCNVRDTTKVYYAGTFERGKSGGEMMLAEPTQPRDVCISMTLGIENYPYLRGDGTVVYRKGKQMLQYEVDELFWNEEEQRYQPPLNSAENDPVAGELACDGSIYAIFTDPDSDRVVYDCAEPPGYFDLQGNKLELGELSLVGIGRGGYLLAHPTLYAVFDLVIVDPDGNQIPVTGLKDEGIDLVRSTDDGWVAVLREVEPLTGQLSRWTISYDGTATYEGDYANLPGEDPNPNQAPNMGQGIIDQNGDLWQSWFEIVRRPLQPDSTEVVISQDDVDATKLPNWQTGELYAFPYFYLMTGP
jgi:hypothetical protein